MHAFDVLGSPVRRRIIELLAEGECASGHLVEIVGREFGVSQPAVSQHLRVLRESGFATVRAEGTRRLYALDAPPLGEVDAWLARLRGSWAHRLDALATEVARGRRARRAPAVASSQPSSRAQPPRHSERGEGSRRDAPRSLARPAAGSG